MMQAQFYWLATMMFRVYHAQLLRRLQFVCSQAVQIQDSLKCKVHSGQVANGRANSLMVDLVRNESEGNRHAHKDDASHMSLAKKLACLTDEIPIPNDRKPLTRMQLKRLIEIRMKKRVKAQYINGKFHDVMEKVIAHPTTLQYAYNSIRLNSNAEPTSDCDGLCFTSIAEQLSNGEFNVKANTLLLSTKTGIKEVLVLPNLKLKVIQEAIRLVIEIVYRPYFSKISHGCRSGRGRHSALRYICKEISNPNWWFTIPMNKKADSTVLTKLISEMEEKIEDAALFSILRCMFDAQVLNFEFGGFPKGQGLPQEGVLSPILMNIYLNLFDHEFFQMCTRYEGLGQDVDVPQEGEHHSNLQHSFMRRLDDDCDGLAKTAGSRIHACRYMDEIFIAVSGSKESAFHLKVEIQNFLKNSLHLDVDDQSEMSSSDNPHGVQFLGITIRASVRENGAVRAVHKLKDKVQLYAAQKQELWDTGTVRIGKKWLAYGLKKIKESEVKHLADSSSILSQISCFRKDGMKTDHWFKFLLKIWMQNVNAKAEDNEEVVLSKYIAEPALPQDLTDSFYNFQKQAQEYVKSETATTLALLSSPSIGNTSSSSIIKKTTTKTEVAVYFIKKSLMRYGLVNTEGCPRCVSPLTLHDDIQIIHWFEGLFLRWLKWYRECDNFGDVKHMIVGYVRNSCIRTLAAKYRMQESEIEKRFESEMSGIPSTLEIEPDMTAMASDFQPHDEDESLMYGITYSGLCMLSLARVRTPTLSCNCHVMGCLAAATGIYALNVKERQKFPGWKTGFSTAIHPSLHRRRIGLCKQHVSDLHLGHISLQCIEFGASCR